MIIMNLCLLGLLTCHRHQYTQERLSERLQQHTMTPDVKVVTTSCCHRNPVEQFSERPQENTVGSAGTIFSERPQRQTMTLDVTALTI